MSGFCMGQGLMLGRKFLSPLQINSAEQPLSSMRVGHKGKAHIWPGIVRIQLLILPETLGYLLELYYFENYVGPFGNRFSLNMGGNQGFAEKVKNIIIQHFLFV